MQAWSVENHHLTRTSFPLMRVPGSITIGPKIEVQFPIHLSRHWKMIFFSSFLLIHQGLHNLGRFFRHVVFAFYFPCLPDLFYSSFFPVFYSSTDSTPAASMDSLLFLFYFWNVYTIFLFLNFFAPNFHLVKWLPRKRPVWCSGMTVHVNWTPGIKRIGVMSSSLSSLPPIMMPCEEVRRLFALTPMRPHGAGSSELIYTRRLIMMMKLHTGGNLCALFSLKTSSTA